MGNQERMESKNDSLKNFSGSAETFKQWAERVMDHMAKVHPIWRPTLEYVAKTNDDLSFARLNQEHLGPFGEPAHELAIKFEQVLVDLLPDSLYQRRMQLCGGPDQRNNGFMMWRRLHSDNIGNEVHIANAGVDCLREYGKCTKMSELMGHLDGWKDLMTAYGQELEGAPNYVKSMYLDILPKELKTEISKEPSLEHAGWRDLDRWVRRRCMVLQTEKLADINKRVLQREYIGKIHALKGVNDDEEKIPLPPTPSPEIAAITAALKGLQNTVAAIQKKSDRPRSKTPPRGRSNSPRSRRDRRSRSSSGSKRLIDWGKKCYHCGKEDHTRNACKEFQKMMEATNRGNPDKKTWKVPAGYESAISKARKAAKAADSKKGSMNVVKPGDDTGSEDEDFDNFSQAGTFSINALRPVTRGTPMAKAKMEVAASGNICSMNKFQPLDHQQEYSDEALKALNSWAGKVQREATSKLPQSVRRAKPRPTPTTATTSDETMASAQSRYPGIGGMDIKAPTPTKTPNKPVTIRDEKDLVKLAGKIHALPSHNKGVAKAFKKISHVDVAEDEMLAMVDSGSFIHAIDAENHLPGHPIEWLSDEESRKGAAETACGGILRRLGLVRCHGTVDGHNVEIQWNHMRVKCPILSVLRLTKEGNEVIIRDDGGEIVNKASGKRIPFFQHNGVYDLRLQVKKPTGDGSESPLFIRHG